jgi:hypothetical protein
MILPDLAGRIASLVVLALAVSAACNTVTQAVIFAPVRKWVRRRNAWLGEVISCPYCFSHWVAALAIAAYRPVLVHSGFHFLDLVVSWLALIALSAFGSGLIIRAFPIFEEPNG